MANWQPISTAPKDGGVILCYDPNWIPETRRVAVCAWQDWGHSYGKWEVVHDMEDYGMCGYEPTYWMPLPTPPEQRP